MAKTLGRSRSMRLRSSPNESESTGNSPVPPFEFHRSGSDGTTSSIASRADSAVNMTRPRTASGDSRKSGHAKHIPIKVNNTMDGFDFTQPSPAPFASPSAEDNTIGMALGSPTQFSPATFAPQPAVYFPSATTTIINADYPPEKETQSKHRVSRWKSFFHKKQAEPTPKQPFYLAQPQPAFAQHHLGSNSSFRHEYQAASPVPSSMVSYDTDVERKRPKSRSRGASEPRRKTTTKSIPLVVDSPKAILVAKAEESPLPPRPDEVAEFGRPRPEIKRVESRYVEVPKVEVPKVEVPKVEIPKVTISRELPLQSPSSPPMLDVDIPKIQMERYSVMFGSLLNNNRNSSLLVRRQGKTDRLKPLEEQSLHPSSSNWKPQRRATSPTIKRSPLSLFPPPEDYKTPKTPRTPKTPQRTGTLNRPRPLQRSRTLPTERSPLRSSFEIVEEGLSEGPSTAGFTDDGASPGWPTVSSDRETFALNNLRKQSSWKPEFQEPSWEIINKTTDSPKKILSPGQTTTLTILEAAPRAHVGVARKVSVSRPHKSAHLLQPTAPLERLVDQKPLTPTLVELRNRKSHRVQIVDA